jgi:GT2 family glycosyltransferase
MTDALGHARADEPRVSAYLVHWHAPVWCAESVAALLASQGVSVEVTVINNGGVLELPPEVTVVEENANLGFAAAANAGLSLAQTADCEYVLIGCHDIRLAGDALHVLIDALEADSGLGVVGPVEGAATPPGSDLDWIAGAAMLMRRPVAEGFRFDERFGSYIEDVDFCYRVRDAGWRVGRPSGAQAAVSGSVDPDAALVGVHANSLVFFARRGMFWAFARRVAFLLVSSVIGPAPRRNWVAALRLGLGRTVRFRRGKVRS